MSLHPILIFICLPWGQGGYERHYEKTGFDERFPWVSYFGKFGTNIVYEFKPL